MAHFLHTPTNSEPDRPISRGASSEERLSLSAGKKFHRPLLISRKSSPQASAAAATKKLLQQQYQQQQQQLQQQESSSSQASPQPQVATNPGIVIEDDFCSSSTAGGGGAGGGGGTGETRSSLEVPASDGSGGGGGGGGGSIGFNLAPRPSIGNIFRARKKSVSVLFDGDGAGNASARSSVAGESSASGRAGRRSSRARMPSLSDLQRQQLIELSKTDFENLHFIDENSLECAESLDLDNLDVLGLIRLNISGTRFEVLRATLLNQRYIYDKLLHDGIYRAAQQEYYFDRDPAIFKIVLWYCRYGELHVPHHYCGPLLERELALWGIQSVIEIQNCCVSHLMDTKSRLVSLKKFENFFKEEMESEPLLLPNSVELEEHLSKDLSKAHGWRKRIKEALIALRKRCWKILDHPSSSFPAAVYAVILSVTVLYTVFSFVASTSERFQRPMTPGEVAFYSAKHPAWYGNRTDASAKIKVDWLTFPDWIAFGTLTFDFCVRFICCKNKLAYFKNNYTIIDFLSILPFYINELLKFFCGIVEFSDSSYFGPAEYIAFLKITLFMRLLRIGRHYRGLQVLIYTLRTSFRDLMLMGVFVALGTLLFSTLIFFCEKSDSQTAAGGGAAGGASGATDCSKCNRQGTDSRFTSMFDGFWWSLVTMTTVGYGDLVPQTWPGRIVGSACALSGLLLIAFTVPILVNHFMLYYSHSQIVHVSKSSVQEYATKALLAKVNSFAGGKVKRMRKLVAEGATHAHHSEKLGKAYWKKRLKLSSKQRHDSAESSSGGGVGEGGGGAVGGGGGGRRCSKHSEPLLGGQNSFSGMPTTSSGDPVTSPQTSGLIATDL